MSRVRVHNFSISLDGFGVGDDQRLDAPFGHAGMRLVQWSFPTRTQQTNLHGAGTAEAAAGSAGIDEVFASRWGAGIGPRSWGATSSHQNRNHGPMKTGVAGGAKTRHFIPR